MKNSFFKAIICVTIASTFTAKATAQDLSYQPDGSVLNEQGVKIGTLQLDGWLRNLSGQKVRKVQMYYMPDSVAFGSFSDQMRYIEAQNQKTIADRKQRHQNALDSRNQQQEDIALYLADRAKYEEKTRLADEKRQKDKLAAIKEKRDTELLEKNRRENKRYVTANTLNMRKSNSPTSEVITKLSFADAVIIQKSSGDWTQVKQLQGELKGWVHSDYIQKNKPYRQLVSNQNSPSDECGKNNVHAQKFKFIHHNVECNAISGIGRDRLSSYDVQTLWMGAEEILRLRNCGKIKDASKSLHKEGAYYVNCTRISKNVFFFRRGNRIGLL